MTTVTHSLCIPPTLRATQFRCSNRVAICDRRALPQAWSTRPNIKKELPVPASVDYRQSARRFGMLLWANLGSCSCCVHSAFRAAFIAWALASSGLAIPIASPILTCIVGIACAFTVLWSVHLLAHALKVSVAARKQLWTSDNQAGISRRNMMPIFARAVVSAAVVASIPTFAFGQCNEAAAARCQAAASDCRAHCNRIFPRAEANHACYQECYANHTSCRTDAGCS
jgi:hypothetical protein